MEKTLKIEEQQHGERRQMLSENKHLFYRNCSPGFHNRCIGLKIEEICGKKQKKLLQMLSASDILQRINSHFLLKKRKK